MNMSIIESSRKDRTKPRTMYKRPDVMMFGLRNVIGTQGGIENHVRHLTEHLAQHDIHLEILVRSPYSQNNPAKLAHNIILTRIWAPRAVALETFVHSLMAVAYAVVRRPRLLHIHAIGPGLMTPFARLFGIKVVVTHHGQDYRREKWGRFARTVLRAGEMLVAHFANECIVVSRPLAADLSKHYSRNFEYIPNGVSLRPTPASDTSIGAFGLQPFRYIVNVGRLVREKRHLDLIQAFLALDRPDLKLVIVGDADRWSAYGRDLMTYAERDNRIVFTGFQQGVELHELFSNAALFTLPSSHEGLPIAVLEAMSYGLPVLVSDIPANLAMNLPDDCYAKTGSIEAWVEGMKCQLDRSALQPRLDWSENLKPYRWGDVTNKTIAIYDRVWQSSAPHIEKR